MIGAVAWFGLARPAHAEVGEVPVPTALALGGGLAGVLLAAVARWANGVGAHRRAAAARRSLTAATSEVARDLVVKPVDAELAALRELRALATRAR